MERVPVRVQIIVAGCVAILLFFGGVKYKEMRLNHLNAEVDVVGAAAGSGSFSQGEEASSPKDLVVHVVGAVEKPGIYCFKEGDRVNEAVQQAVPLAKADLSQLNLALPLQDGKQIDVPFQDTGKTITNQKITSSKKTEKQKTVNQKTTDQKTTESSFAHSTAADQIGQTVTTNGKINLNTANKDELMKLSGIGPALAGRIIDYREKEGPFSTIEDLTKVSGIGTATLAKFKEKITVE